MSINTSSPFLFVDQVVSPYIGQNGPAAGMVRFNTSNQHLEAFDGNIWIRLADHQNLSMTQEAVDAIRWARDKIAEEQRLKQLAEKHPGVADAMQELQRASEQLEIMVQLVNQDKTPVA
jgi:flagellar hook-basal body complex protein FliE